MLYSHIALEIFVSRVFLGYGIKRLLPNLSTNKLSFGMGIIILMASHIFGQRSQSTDIKIHPMNVECLLRVVVRLVLPLNFMLQLCCLFYLI